MTKRSPLPSLENILEPIQDHLQAVENLLIQNLEAKIPLLGEVGNYILKSGGKRVRPALLLLAAGSAGEITEKTYVAACIIEYIHTATLLHDDVVDNATLRRSKKSARTIWGNEASVLVGDYLFGASFKHLASLKNLRLIEILSDTSTQMAKGEIKQLSRDHNNTSEADYLDIIFYKTASLMGSAMQIGAILGGANEAKQQALLDCGINIGMAFQLVDDALDYDLANVEKGKQAGVDLKERKVTLPLNHILEVTTASEKEKVLSILDGDIITDDQVEFVCGLVDKYQSIPFTLDRAQSYIQKAKETITPFRESRFKTATELLADFIVFRKK